MTKQFRIGDNRWIQVCRACGKDLDECSGHKTPLFLWLIPLSLAATSIVAVASRFF